jgi:S1-C subfamily serine protease
MRGLLPVAAAALLLAACDSVSLPGQPPEPEPIELSYHGGAAEGPVAERTQALARALAGVYVRVLIVDSREVRAGRDAMIKPGIVTGASGAIVDGRGYIITAAHIALNPELEARVTTADGVVRPAAVVAVAPGRELALLKMEPYPGMEVARLGDSGALSPGDAVFTIGTPDNKKGVVFTGRVDNPRREQRIQYGEFGYDDAIELTLDAEPGVSGGPLFDSAGTLIGIVASFSMGNTNPQGYKPTRLAWAVPSNAIAAYLREVAGP